jgi:hypothetical protein
MFVHGVNASIIRESTLSFLGMKPQSEQRDLRQFGDLSCRFDFHEINDFSVLHAQRR